MNFMRIAMLLVLACGLLFGQTEDPTIPLDFTDLFSERGFYKSATLTGDLNEVISEFNGNLNVSIPLFAIKGKGGLDVNLALNYNGGMGYSVINQNSGTSGFNRDWLNVNGPGWVLSLNGIAIQTFNFEGAYYSRGHQRNGAWKAENGEISLLSNGYHFTDNITYYGEGDSPKNGETVIPDKNIISLLSGDGSTLSLINPTSSVITWDHGFTGEFRADDLFGKEKALVWETDNQENPGFDRAASKNRSLLLFPGDGTRITFAEQHTRLFLDYLMPPEIGLQQFYPIRIEDGLKNAINITYQHYYPHRVGNQLTLYTVLGHPLVDKISVPGIDDRQIELAYIHDPYFQTIRGLTISFGDQQYSLTFRDGDGGPIHVPYVDSEEWEDARRNRNTLRGGSLGAIAYVSEIIDPAGRVYQFDYQTYRRNLDIQQSQAYDWVPQIPDLDHHAPQKLEVVMARLQGIRYPEGRRTQYVYYEEGEHAIPGLDLESYEMPILTGAIAGDWFASASPYMANRNGSGGTGRDAFYSNIISERTVSDLSGGGDPVPVRRDQYHFTWENVNYNANPTGVPGYRGLDYADVFKTTYRQFSFADGVPVEERKKFQEFRMMPYRNMPKASQDLGYRILLKKEIHYDTQGSRYHQMALDYSGEAGFERSHDRLFQGNYLEKIRQEDTYYPGGQARALGVQRWHYTPAADGLTFSEIRHTDSRGMVSISHFDEDFLITPGSLRSDSYYATNLSTSTELYPDSLRTGEENLLGRHQAEYFTYTDRGEFQFLTVKSRRPRPVSHPDSVIISRQPDHLAVGYKNEPTPYLLDDDGETRHEAFIGFTADFPATIRSEDSPVSTAVLEIYVKGTYGPLDGIPTRVHQLLAPWNPYVVDGPVPGSVLLNSNLTVTQPGWISVNLTQQLRDWQNSGAPFYGVKLALPGDPDPEQAMEIGYELEGDRYSPEMPEPRMARLRVSFHNGVEKTYQTYNGYPDLYGGVVGQKKAVRELDVTAGRPTRTRMENYRYYLHGPFGNTFEKWDNSGSRVQYHYHAREIEVQRVLPGGQTRTEPLALPANPVFPNSIRFIPEEAGQEPLETYQILDAGGRPVVQVDANGTLYQSSYDKLGRITTVTHPFDFEGLQAQEVDTVLQRSASHLLLAYFNVNPDKAPTEFWTYQGDRSSLMVRNDVRAGVMSRRAYLGFDNLDEVNITGINRAELFFYCDEIREYLPGPVQIRLSSVRDSWDRDYNDNFNPPERGTFSQTIAAIVPGWNRVDISPWVEAFLGDPQHRNGFMLDVVAAAGEVFVDYALGHSAGTQPYLILEGQVERPVDAGFTLRQQYDDPGNRIISERRYGMRNGELFTAKSELEFDGLARITHRRAYQDGQQFHEQQTAYDFADQAVLSTKPMGNATTTAYDFLGRPQTVENPDGSRIVYQYQVIRTLPCSYQPVSGERLPEAILFKTAITDEAGLRVDNYSDSDGNMLLRIEDPEGEAVVTRFFYSLPGNLVRVRKHLGDEVRYQYSSLGQMSARTSADQGRSEMVYNLAGDLRFAADANMRMENQIAFTHYDGMKRPLLSGRTSANLEDLDPDLQHNFEENPENWRKVYHYDTFPDIREFPWSHFDLAPLSGQLHHLKGRLAASAVLSGPPGLPEILNISSRQFEGPALLEARLDILAGNGVVVQGDAELRLAAGRAVRLTPGFQSRPGARITVSVDTRIQLRQAEQGWIVELFDYDPRGRVSKKFVFQDEAPETVQAYQYN
ncbi:MAG TPA: hypothetical protein PKV71_01700, partial [Calditrichia bacterium]|nr:hypothetical protein [Calditrichia bacterium]